MVTRTCLAVLGVLFFAQTAFAQLPVASPAQEPTLAPRPETFEVLNLNVDGVSDKALRTYVRQVSGLRVGQRLMLPADPAIAEAIRAIYRLRRFSDVKIVVNSRAGDGLFMTIRVEEAPRLAGYTFEGVKKDHRKDLERKLFLFTGGHVQRSEIERARQVVRDYFEDKGYLLADVQARPDTTAPGEVTIAFAVDRGPRVEVGDVIIEGNEALSDGQVRRQMTGTEKKRWWRFWGNDTFDADAYEQDLDRVVAYYHEKGHFDARIVHDTLYVRQDDGKPEIVVEVNVAEGPRYHLRHITWDGNTVFSDDDLTQALGFAPGHPYNSKKLEENLIANPRGLDVAGLYLNRGYMRFNAQPSVTVVEGDSLDLHFDVFEGGVYTFGEINIDGNVATKDHVIRRELYTTPGQTFSRATIQESIRRLIHLNYFEMESLTRGPEILVDDEKQQVDLTYTVAEESKNPLSVAGTYGNTGLILQFGLTHNNFSLKSLFDPSTWRPLPTGDGQLFSLGIQTSGRDFQRYSLSFTEPWFQGKPTPIGFSLSHTRLRDNDIFETSNDDGSLINASARVFYDQRLKWPDDKFTLSSSVRYQYFNNDAWTEALPLGVSRELVFRQALSRNSLDHPIFPTQGSRAQLSVEVAPSFAGFTQYHKWRFQTNWNTPLAKKLTFGVSTDVGYVGSLNGEAVEFERFIVGGSPFETQGINGFLGRDVIYLRGYPIEAIGPRQDGTPIGGRILNKYSAELRWHAVQTPQLTAVPYVFFDAANTWNDTGSYNPADLFRSAGVGARFSLPVLGVIELSYGYNFDTFSPLGNEDGTRSWRFQFSLGQTFNF